MNIISKVSLILLSLAIVGCFEEDDNCVEKEWYRDYDGDCLGTPDVFTLSCAPVAGFVDNNLDANDSVLNNEMQVDLFFNRMMNESADSYTDLVASNFVFYSPYVASSDSIENYAPEFLEFDGGYEEYHKFQQENFNITHYLAEKGGAQYQCIDVVSSEGCEVTRMWRNQSIKTHDIGQTILNEQVHTDSTLKIIEQYIQEIMIDTLFASKDNLEAFIDFDVYEDYGFESPRLTVEEFQSSLRARNINKLGVYERRYYIFGQNNMALVMSETPFDSLSMNSQAYFDLYSTDGEKIVRHWEVIESLPSRDTWKQGASKW